MNRLKAVGLAVLAVIAVMAFAGSASATVLCSTNTNPCTGTKYGVGTEIKTNLKAGTEAVLTAGFATFKCSESALSGKVANAGGAAATLSGNNTLVTFDTCNCTLTVILQGSEEFHWNGTNGSGTLTSTGTSTTINCSGVSCLFGTAATGTTIGPVTGGSPASIKAEAKLPYITGDASNFTCTLGSGTASFTASYEVTAPKPLFVEGS